MGLDRKALGRSQLKLSVLGFGGTGLGNMYVAMSEHSAIDTPSAAYAAGMRYYDTAPLYGHGLSELRTGSGPRLFGDPGDFDCFLLAGRYTLLEQESLRSFLPVCEKRHRHHPRRSVQLRHPRQRSGQGRLVQLRAGAGRLLWGSDWPVMLLNADYPGWLVAAKQFIASHSAADQMAIMNGNAIRFYRLPVSAP